MADAGKLQAWGSARQSQRSNRICYSRTMVARAENFTVGLVQMSCTPDPDENLERAIARVAEAAGRGAKVVCLPELFQTQYFCQREDVGLFDLAEPIPGPSSTRLSQVARQQGVALIASLLEK